jgi:two-component system, chemotaxis family, sensor kinase CheA
MALDKLQEMFVLSCNEQLANIETAILDLEGAPASERAAALAAVMRAAHTIKGDAASLGASALATFCHKIETVLQLLRDGALPVSGELAGELLRAFDLVKAVAARAGQGDEPELDRGLLRLERLAEGASKSAPGNATGVFPGREERAVLAAAPDAARISSITLPSEDLDALLDLVGELGIAQARLSGLAKRRRDRDMDAVSEEIERLSSLLRDKALGMRMLPLQVGFAKYRRLIRDACAKLGKKAEFRMHGETTELDKTVIERLNTPFIHLLRNAVDHGLEPPEVRRALGKPEAGRIEVEARQEGGEAALVVRDDGSGIDGDALYRRAVALGRIAPESRLSEAEKLELIFMPGLSTAETVGEVSGRGVGMDAVREGIRGLRGRIEATSVPGKGTAFTIRLPSSLAIIDCLRVRMGSDLYYFHLDYVEECLEVDFSGQGAGRVRQGAGVIEFRGKPLPLLYLRAFFRQKDEAPEQAHVVVVQTQEGRFGVVADEVLGRGQAVIKGLGPALGAVPGILGGTVTEDGDMALVLDIPTLARTALAENQRNEMVD